MEKTIASGVFKQTPRADKADATTRAARDIIARETAERDAKTKRLRALRLAKEAADTAEAAAASPPAKKTRVRKAG